MFSQLGARMKSTHLVLAMSGLALGSTACHRQVSAEDHSAHMAASPAMGVAQQSSSALPASNNAAAARLSSSTRKGEWFTVLDPESKKMIQAWIVYPSNTRAKAPVVIVVHDINGLSAWGRAVADQVASEGFIAVSPDFASIARGGGSPVELPRDSANKLLSPLPSAERSRIIAATAAYAMALPQAEHRYAVIGYCWGGGTVFMHAVNGGVAGFSGGVAYYGLPYMNGAAPVRDSLAKIKVPVMLFNGSKDARIGAAIPGVDSAMKAFGKDFVGTNYEGATHGFMRSQDDPKAQRDLAEEAANLAATKDAWPRTVQFLKRNLGAR
jgi:carboxymethylenebutenolidase